MTKFNGGFFSGWRAVVFLFAVILIGFSSCKEKDILIDSNDELGFNRLDSITLQLEQIKVLFPTVEQWEEKGAIRFSKDSAIIFDKNGEMLLNKSFAINADAAKTLSVEQQYQTTLSIITTGDNIDLTKLNSYVSPWTKIDINASNRYDKRAYTMDEIRRYPATSIQDVLDYIFLQTRTTQSEFDWNKYLKQAKTIQDFPFEIRISKITLRFKGEYINGQPFEKYIVFYLGTNA